MSKAPPVIPLDRTAAGRLVLWSLAALVYLAVVAVAVAGAAHQLLGAAEENATVAIVSLPAPLDPTRVEGDIAGVTALLLADPDISRVDRIQSQEVMEILGSEAAASPLPSLIELRFRPALEPDFDRITALVRSIASDAVVEDAGKAGGARIEVALTLRSIGLVVATALVAAAVVLVVAVVRAAVHHHGDIVELLRLLGARDRFVAQQFQRHVQRTAIKGSLVGFALAAITIVVLVDAGGLLELPGLAELTSMPAPWAVLALVPLILVIVLTMVSRITAALTLRHLTSG